MKDSRPYKKPPPTDTRRRISTLIGIVAICALLSAACSAKDESPTAKEAREATALILKIRSMSTARQALELENRVAREYSPYLVVDFSSKRIELKARGRTLRLHALNEFEFVLIAPPGNDRWNVTGKKPLRELQRSQVAPGNGEDGGESALDTSWGPAKMPPEFDLLCDGGRALEIRRSPDTSSRIIRAMHGVFARFADGARRLRGSSSKAEGGRIRLWLRNEDSRTLYWSLPEKLPVLFRTAAGLEADPPPQGDKTN